VICLQRVSLPLEKNAVLCPQRVYLPLAQNALICPQRAILPIQSVAKARCMLKWPIGALFFFLNLLGPGMCVGGGCDKKLYKLANAYQLETRGSN
jgi:hypothetical protein